MGLPSSSANYLISGESNAVYRGINFIQNTIRNIVEVFPNMIINNVEYMNVSIPKHWDLSLRHNADIIMFLQKYYFKLRSFGSDKTIIALLKDYVNKCKDILKVVNATPFISKTAYSREEDNSLFDERTVKILFNYYFYLCFKIFIDLLNEKDVYVSKKLRVH